MPPRRDSARTSPSTTYFEDADQCNKLVGKAEPLTLSYAGDGPIVRGRRNQRSGDTDPLGAEDARRARARTPGW